MKCNKTNAMRILDTLKIPYEYQTYECDTFRDGVQIADMLGLDHTIVYKTLVTVSPRKEYYVFVLPVDKELDLKKCAKAVGAKSLALIPVKQIQQVTGYIRGGCTAIGMKKLYPTRIDTSAEQLDRIVVSGGRLGIQLSLNPYDLAGAAKAEFAEITQDP